MIGKELNKIWGLLEAAAHAPTKAAAKQPLSTLRSILATHRADLPGYTAGKLSEAISCASEASGQVKNKEHWVTAMHGAWYVFKSDVESGQTYSVDQ